MTPVYAVSILGSQTQREGRAALPKEFGQHLKAARRTGILTYRRLIMKDRHSLLSKRRQLASWPRWMQPFLTWLSGISLPNETRKYPWTPRQHLIAYFATLILAGALGVQMMQRLVAASSMFFS